MMQYIKKDGAGNKFWYKDKNFKVRHRVDGPAVKMADGYKEWWVNGKLHREDGPAIEWMGRTKWYRNGKLHRVDGPAIEYADGDKEWWLKGKEYTEAEFKAIVNKQK